MKLKTLQLLGFIVSQNYSQVSVSPSHVIPKKKFERGYWKNLKTPKQFLFSPACIITPFLNISSNVTPFQIDNTETYRP